MPDTIRHRERNLTDINGTVYWMHQQPGQNPTISSSLATLASRDRASVDDVSHSNFLERQRRGELIADDFSCTRNVISAGGGSYNATNASGERYYSSLNGPGSVTTYALAFFPVSAPSITVPDYTAAAKLEALANVDSAFYDLAEDIGQVALVIPNAVSALGRLATGLSKRAAAADAAAGGPKVWSAGKQTREHERARNAWLKAPANHWAQYRFGILPALSSLEGVAYATAQHVRALRSGRKSAHGRGQFNDSKAATTVNSVNTYATGAAFRGNCMATVLYSRRVPRTLFDDLNLRKKNLPKTAWNLVPLSFMVDRVVNISGMFAGLGNLADSNIMIEYACVSKKTYSATTIKWIKQVQSGWTATVDGDTVLNETYTTTRQRWHPTVWDTIPVDFAGRLLDNIPHILDAVALVAQRAKRN